VALDGLENILKVGDMDKEAQESTVNQFALFIEECGGMEKIHDCQNNSNEEIYMKAYNIIEKYFSDEEGEGGDISEVAPQQGENGQFGFGAQTQQNFSFANGGDSMDM
ncbi:hypothetical protein LTR28_012247, partial [Elasticomyces elasticus]